MAETQVTQKLINNPLTTPVLFRTENANTGGGNGFVTMLQALDSTLTAAAQPQPLAPEAPTSRPAPKSATDSSNHDDAPEPPPTEGRATDDHAHAPPSHDVASKSTKHGEHECRQSDENTKTPDAAPEAKDAPLTETAPEIEVIAEAAAPVEETAKPQREEKATAPTVNLLAGLAVPNPKTTATQKASPETESCVAGTGDAATAQPIAAPDAKTAGATTGLETTTGQGVAEPTATGEKPALTPKLAAQTTPAPTSGNDGQPQANDNNPLRQFALSTPEATLTEQRHTAESDAAVSAANNPATAAPTNPTPSFTPLSAAPPAAKPAETPQQLQTRLETNSVRGIEGGVRLLNSYSNTAQLTAARSAQTATLRAPEIIEQVAVKLNHQAKTGLDTMTIQLRPADLGRIDVKLNFHDGSVSGTIIADSQTTLDLLVKDQRALERALQDSGLRTDSGSLSFQLRDQSGQQAAQQERGSKRNGWQDIAFESGADVALIADNNGESVISADRVNLRV